MAIYRKRGSDVDAFQFAVLEPDDLAPRWLRDHVTLGKARVRRDGDVVQMFLDPPSGKGAPLPAALGDWVVRNARGDVFPLTPEKFAATYEEVECSMLRPESRAGVSIEDPSASRGGGVDLGGGMSAELER